MAGNMKYIVVDDCGTDIFTEEYDSREEAIAAAETIYKNLTTAELKRRKEFYILESVNPDIDAENHMDGHIIRSFYTERRFFNDTV